MTTASAPQSARPHVAVRLEEGILGTSSALLRRRGWLPQVVPYTSYGSTSWVRILGRVLLAPPDAPDDPATPGRQPVTPPEIRGWRHFLTAQVPGEIVRLRIGDREHELITDRGGYVDAVVRTRLDPGWHDLPMWCGARAARRARVRVVADDARLGLVSDIDDTVMVTSLPRPLIAAWNSFVLRESARRVVPGMAELYARIVLAHPDAVVVYLSTGAWNVASPLRRFLARRGYPEGPLLLTDWGPTNTGWFRSGQEHKNAALHRLAREFPGVRWLLVGDDGQHDPQIYADFAAAFPDRVAAIAIRELTTAQRVLSHGSPLPAEADPATGGPVGPVTVHAPDGAGLTAELMAVTDIL